MFRSKRDKAISLVLVTILIISFFNVPFGGIKSVNAESSECEHEWVEDAVEIEATCEGEGLILYKCTLCGETEYREVAPLGHDEEYTEYIEPTCTEPGWMSGIICADCGEIIVDGEEISPWGHSMIYFAEEEPTCTESGHVEYWVCEDCGRNFADEDGEYEIYDINDVTIPAEHNLTAHEAVTATC